MTLRKAGLAAATALALSLTATACGGDSGSGGDKVTVGIKFDQPGLGLKTQDGDYTGFDVDVAKYVAKELGHEEGDIEWKQAPSNERENMIVNGDVDFIVATYTINDERKERVSFAGPYFVAHQDLLLRADDTSITSETDLNSSDLKLCSVVGSTSAQNVKNKFAPKADLQEYGGYSECLTGLENEAVDALTTDDSILAGYAAQKEHQGKFKLAGLSLSDEPYGIGLKKGDTELQQKINDALKKMVDEGAWEEAAKKHFGPANYEYEAAPEITETS
ncbi:glutamate ABC transporter substrate-binding protein [Streptomyces sp. TRM 70361]|uniref:glutamate ABC transporter substrate-binding protein n=1 Tax=Streptomyces sp. TRM 70361 TaxID=3116553 RepID=UPI002E7C0254|nr:glutamate ABC transporter substrate-binding protein [Streptomyces sp. TRM 70361]MEE1940867.1 glutamate ABC transporter substrate-binding protein [Streptomyces sp. TRM 70361]